MHRLSLIVILACLTLFGCSQSESAEPAIEPVITSELRTTPAVSPSSSVEAPGRTKYGEVGTEDGSKLLYTYTQGYEDPNGTIPSYITELPPLLGVYHKDNKQETLIQVNGHYGAARYSFSWANDAIIIVTLERDNDNNPITITYDSRTGEELLSANGKFKQLLSDTGAILTLIDNRWDPESSPQPLRIEAAFPNEEPIVLYEQEVYETEFVDVRISNSFSVIAVWTHLVPENTSELSTAPLDTSHTNWTVGEWVKYTVDPELRGTIAFDEANGYIILGGEQSVPLPAIK